MTLIGIAQFFLGISFILLALVTFGVWTAPVPVFGFVFAVTGICYVLLAFRVAVRSGKT